MLLRATRGESKGMSEGVGKVLLRGVSGSIALVCYLVELAPWFLSPDLVPRLRTMHGSMVQRRYESWIMCGEEVCHDGDSLDVCLSFT